MKPSHFFGFRCDSDEQIAELLLGEENRSETIIRALREYYRRNHAVTCPTCNGSGFVYNPIGNTLKDGGKVKHVKHKGDTPRVGVSR